MKIKELLEYGRNNLIEKESLIRISKILLKSILNVDETYILIHNETEVEDKKSKQFIKDINLLNSGMPLQYILNNQEFMKLDFYVDENVLIPQPDTEILVEEVITRLEKNETSEILDMCTGSGAIGISLAKYLDNAKVTMSDISIKALEIAEKNAIKNDVKANSFFVLSNMFENINGKFDAIVSNPPYIETDEIDKLSKEVQNEPIIALDGGRDGLEFYRIIVQNAYKYININGILALEIGYNQKDAVITLLENTNQYNNIYCKKDLSGNDRVIIAKIN